jgi:NADH:ubiquinone oxidoreductase subunit 2 (subunit N)
MFQFLILDGINKIALFSLVAHYQNQTNDLSFKNFKYIEDNRNFKILAAFILLFSAGLPLTAMFIVKLKMFDILIANDLFLELGVVLFGGLCALLYHFKLLKALFFTPKSAGTIQIVTKNYSLIAIVFVQILALLYINDIALITDYTKIILFN